ncbi:hypothetical protein DFH07DRAFT_1063687 [Mycena maculata]|uniref:Uncharacterized protein n=1 Tax=Mycena maculata TaxID=230809 RepID=A0AAD7II35_9AGAR|nr:hypothetical protein DFH07DRAFT_1063687 [Mycena maculata]
MPSITVARPCPDLCPVQAHAQGLAQKRSRVPLATKCNVNGIVAIAPTKLSLPRTLPRPVLREVEVNSLLDAYPACAGIPAEYIRDHLPLSTMRAALQAVATSVPESSLPKELDILMNDIVAAACPTHMFAVYGDASPACGQKRRVTLFPAHALVFGTHCANLPALPASQPSTSSARATVPVVPVRLPSPETFPLLQSYLYTQQPPSLAPPCDSDLLRLAPHAKKVYGLWRNACVLGVVDAPLYDAIEASWERTLSAIQACS